MNILHTNMKLLKDLIRRGILRIFPFPQKVIVIVVVNVMITIPFIAEGYEI